MFSIIYDKVLQKHGTCHKMLNILKILLFLGIGTVIVNLLLLRCPRNPKKIRLKKHLSYKYILIWTFPYTLPFATVREGLETFYTKNCAVRNCYITSHKNFLKDITDFDVLLFHGKEIFYDGIPLPRKRSQKQLYVYTATESSHYYPVFKGNYNRSFNVTWSYKLNSDIYYGYIKIRDKHGTVIGPRDNMKWLPIDKMLPIDNNTKNMLSNKNKLGAWFVSNCNSKSRRETVVNDLQNELNEFGLTIDVYGGCGNKVCEKKDMKECLKKIQKDYYFYLSFENSISEDYVTEKLLRALNNYAIPVVYGGANYSRFMPEGIYLDASRLSTRELAFEMVKIINNKDILHNYFRWHNHYSYHNLEESSETDPYCNLCAIILKEIGFEFVKLQSKRSILMERHDIKIHRYKFLEHLKKNRESEEHNKLDVIYLDETYIHSSCSVNKCSQSKDVAGPSKSISSGARWIIVNAGGENGFVPNCCLVYKSKSLSADYHHDMNKDNFKKWVIEKLIPNLTRPSLIVMDNGGSRGWVMGVMTPS